MNSASRFWVVITPNRRVPSEPHIHLTFESADKEATRLAEEHPGEVFHVLASVCAIQKTTVHRINFDNNQCESCFGVPF